MIEEQPLNGFNHKLKYDELDYPNCECGKCFKMFFNLLSVASRQSGKTWTICQYVKHLEKNKLKDKDGVVHPLRTILISPTIEANPIFTSLQSLNENDIHTDYSDDLLQSIIDDVKQKREETDAYKEYVEAYKIMEKTPEADLGKLYDKRPDVFKLLEKEDYKTPNEIEQPTFYEYPVNMCILDDLMGTASFSNKKSSKLTNAIIKNRHLGIVFCILVQSIKSVPKNIRLNCSVFHLGRFANKKMITEDIYDEVSNVLKPEQFEEMYDHATQERYGSLIIDCSGKEKRFMRGLDTELFLA